MRIVSIGGVPEHKQQARAELAAMVAQFEQGRTQVVPDLAETANSANITAPGIGPHSATSSDERSIVMELRAIRAEARRLISLLPSRGQAAFE